MPRETLHEWSKSTCGPVPPLASSFTSPRTSPAPAGAVLGAGRVAPKLLGTLTGSAAARAFFASPAASSAPAGLFRVAAACVPPALLHGTAAAALTGAAADAVRAAAGCFGVPAASRRVASPAHVFGAAVVCVRCGGAAALAKPFFCGRGGGCFGAVLDCCAPRMRDLNIAWHTGCVHAAGFLTGVV